MYERGTTGGRVERFEASTEPDAVDIGFFIAVVVDFVAELRRSRVHRGIHIVAVVSEMSR